MTTACAAVGHQEHIPLRPSLPDIVVHWHRTLLCPTFASRSPPSTTPTVTSRRTMTIRQSKMGRRTLAEKSNVHLMEMTLLICHVFRKNWRRIHLCYFKMASREYSAWPWPTLLARAAIRKKQLWQHLCNKTRQKCLLFFQGYTESIDWNFNRHTIINIEKCARIRYATNLITEPQRHFRLFTCCTWVDADSSVYIDTPIKRWVVYWSRGHSILLQNCRVARHVKWSPCLNRKCTDV